MRTKMQKCENYQGREIYNLGSGFIICEDGDEIYFDTKEEAQQYVDSLNKSSLTPENTIMVQGKGGVFDAVISQDPNYPGIDVEFKQDNADEDVTAPRIVFEQNEQGELRVLIWDDPNNEDYTKEIKFPPLK